MRSSRNSILGKIIGKCGYFFLIPDIPDKCSKTFRITELATNDDGYIEKPLRRQLAPDTASWRDVEVPIKNQGPCGSCKIIISPFFFLF